MCIRDRYYPTQYSIELDCRKAGLSRKDSVLFLNRLTEEYSNQFFENYGYNKSLENAVISIDYNDYDYVDAVSVFDSSLKSLKEYIDDLAKHDNIRFRSDQDVYKRQPSGNVDRCIRYLCCIVQDTYRFKT